MKVKFCSHTDRIIEKDCNGSKDFAIGDIVVFTSNGLSFQVENKKMLIWMRESGLYFKIS